MSGTKDQRSEEEILGQLVGDEQRRQLRERGLEVVVSLLPNELSQGERCAAVEKVVSQSRQSQAKAQRLAALGTMGAGIVHEARNLLTAVAGFAHLAQRGSNETRRAEQLINIEAETKRAVEMLGHFLAFARNRPKSATVFAITEPLARARRATLHQLQVHQVELIVAPADAALQVVGSPGEIEQVLVNLILNAQQASPKGGQVQVAATGTKAGLIEITVRDAGSGIAKEQLEEIFEPFFTTKTSGTGLGLAVSKRIAEEHGGDLRAESASGVGTTFTLSLPTASGKGEQNR